MPKVPYMHRKYRVLANPKNEAQARPHSHIYFYGERLHAHTSTQSQMAGKAYSLHASCKLSVAATLLRLTSVDSILLSAAYCS
jgi:hypothetical protein